MKQVLKFLAIFFIILSLIVSCKKGTIENNQIIAKVGNVTLLKKDIIFKMNTMESHKDSTKVIEEIAKEWIIQQLILQKADEYLTAEDRERIDLQVQNYKSILLTFKYKERFIEQKLDTIIKPIELNDYYNLNNAKYKLTEDYARSKIIILSKKAPHVEEFIKWANADEQKKMKFEEYAQKNGTIWSYESWAPVSAIFKVYSEIKIKTLLSNKNNYVKYSTDENYYLIKIYTFCSKGETAPIDIIVPEIKEDILTYRKKTLYNELGSEILKKALEEETAKIY